MTRTIALMLGCLAAGCADAMAQAPARSAPPMPDRWLQGFSRAVSGELLVYPWAYPGQSRALLTRATDGTMRIEWEGEALPPGVTDDRVTYLWHAGMASGHGAHRFTLTLNGAPCVTFTSGRDTGDREWAIDGAGGCSLAFETTRVGTFDELFGLMWLTVPRAAVALTPPRFAIVGEAADSRDYYMTFQEPVRPWTRATAEEARFADGSRVVSIEVGRAGNPSPMIVRIGSELAWRGNVGPGYTGLALGVRAPGTSVQVVVEIDGVAALSQRVAMTPVRAWEIHLLPHSHVDVGYSDPQPAVERKQWKNLREAVELAAATRAFPDDSRFRWNTEGVWPVESYLRQASDAERAAFAAAVREGSIDVQANYTNILTGISTPEELARWTDGARRLQREFGLGPMPTAMHTDIPGVSWTVVRALVSAGVRYFSSGPNYMPGLPDGGDRIGRTLEALGDRPFWWESPSGEERLLFWMAHRGYSWFHGLNLGRLEDAGQRAFLDSLRQLAAEGYPYDMLQVRYTIGGDNGPVDPRLPEFVKAWNEKYATPRIVINTARRLFAEFERRHGAGLPVRRGDMTPYWEDGAVSSAAEEALARAASRRLQQAEAVWALRNPSAFPASKFDEAWRNVTMWHEHTWGAADSVSQPDREDVVGQWLYKREFAVQADRQSSQLMADAVPVAGGPFEAINTLSWPRDALLVLGLAQAAGRARVVDSAGQVWPSQQLADGRLAVLAPGVPALGSLRFRTVPGRSAPPASPARVEGSVLDNGLVRVDVDQSTGDITGLRIAAAPGVQFARAGAGLNAYRYVPGLDPAKAQPPGPPAIVIEEPGPLVVTLRIDSDAPGARRLTRRVTLVAGDERVYLETTLDKQAVRAKESAHVAFPFDLPSAVVRVDQGEALIEVGRDQLPGSCMDFVGAHSAVDVSDDRAGIGVATLDAPLVEIGAMTDERTAGGRPRTWRSRAAQGGAVFAYLLNNYWHTNFKADQAGEMRFRFVLQPHGRFDPLALRRLSAGVDQPLVVSRVPANSPLTPPPFRLEGTPAMVSSLSPLADGRGLTARIYNPTGAPTTFRLEGLWRGRVVTRISATGRTELAADRPIELRPFAAVTLEITRSDPEERR